FFSLIGVGCLYEFYGMVSKAGVKPQVFWGIVTALLLSVLIGLHCVDVMPFAKVWLIIPMFPAMCIIALFQKRERPFDDIAYTSLGIGYAFLPFCSLLHWASCK